MKEIQNIHEQNFINVLRAKVNDKVSPIIDTFSGWLIGGFGAASALLVSQYGAISTHISPEQLRCFLQLFMVALVVAVAQKLISSLIIASAKASMVASELGEKASKESIQLDFKIIFNEIERSIFPYSRWAVRRSFKKVLEGNLVTSSRNSVRLSQLQSLLVIAQAVITLIAIYKLSSGFQT